VAAPSRRRYVDDVALSYAPSAIAHRTARDLAARLEPVSALAVENPGGDATGYLPFAADEVGDVVRRFPRHKTLGHGVSARTVLPALRHYPVLHFACHGFAAQDPLRSALLMGGGEPLTVDDLMAASISARLAVLSACETAISGQRLPYEVLGLPMGMLAAGVAGVVGSLWSVPDLATRILVARFYALWRGDGMEPAEALRRAQMWIRDATNGDKWEMFGDVPGGGVSLSV